MISAHWFYAYRLQVTSGEHPEMIYDFDGFPEELSQVRYPAPGSPELAEQVRSLLQPENVGLNPTRGFDHGAWAVLKFLYPDARYFLWYNSALTVCSRRNGISIWRKNYPPCANRGVLIIGSGNIIHNLSVMQGRISIKSARVMIGRLRSAKRSIDDCREG